MDDTLITSVFILTLTLIGIATMGHILYEYRMAPKEVGDTAALIAVISIPIFLAMIWLARLMIVHS